MNLTLRARQRMAAMKQMKKNKKKIVKMTRADFVKEHKRLIPILRSGDRKKQVREALDQQRELMRII